MIAMTNDLKALAAAALLLAALNVPCRAEDAAAAPPAATQEATKPTDVPRPSITAKSSDTAAPDAASEPAPRHRRHYAHRYYRYRHYAYWEPFPVYLPHLYRNRIVWNRVSWFHN
jgi:hypothetical protein